MKSKFNWSSSNYRDLLNTYMGYRNSRRPRGAVSALAKRMGCHTTFIAQVMKGRANLSLEQGLRASEHFGWSNDESAFFLALISYERAGTVSLRNHFKAQLDQYRAKQTDLKSRLGVDQPAVKEHEFEYFGNWACQVVHALVFTGSQISIPKLASALNLDPESISYILDRLETMGLIQAVNKHGRWQTTQKFLHLSRESPAIRHLHLSWRGKVISDLQTQKLNEGLHYSSVMTISRSDFEKSRQILIQALQEIKEIASESQSEQPHVLCIDAYPLLFEPK